MMIFTEFGFYYLLSPYFLTGTSRMHFKIFVARGEMQVDGLFTFLYAVVITVMDNRFGQAGEHRLYHI